jgi:hypothetical protein
VGLLEGGNSIVDFFVGTICHIRIAGKAMMDQSTSSDISEAVRRQDVDKGVIRKGRWKGITLIIGWIFRVIWKVHNGLLSRLFALGRASTRGALRSGHGGGWRMKVWIGCGW